MMFYHSSSVDISRDIHNYNGVHFDFQILEAKHLHVNIDKNYQQLMALTMHLRHRAFESRHFLKS